MKSKHLQLAVFNFVSNYNLKKKKAELYSGHLVRIKEIKGSKVLISISINSPSFWVKEEELNLSKIAIETFLKEKDPKSLLDKKVIEYLNQNAIDINKNYKEKLPDHNNYDVWLKKLNKALAFEFNLTQSESEDLILNKLKIVHKGYENGESILDMVTIIDNDIKNLKTKHFSLSSSAKENNNLSKNFNL